MKQRARGTGDDCTFFFYGGKAVSQGSSARAEPATAANSRSYSGADVSMKQRARGTGDGKSTLAQNIAIKSQGSSARAEPATASGASAYSVRIRVSMKQRARGTGDAAGGGLSYVDPRLNEAARALNRRRVCKARSV